MTGRPWELRPLDREAVAGLQEAIAEERTDQLEMEAAYEGNEWDDAKHDAVLNAQLKEASLLAGLLAARGLTQPEEALSFLAGEDTLSDPMLMQDMDKACARIRQALDTGETHRGVWGLRRGRRHRHLAAVRTAERAGRDGQMYAAQPGRGRLRPCPSGPSTASTIRAIP